MQSGAVGCVCKRAQGSSSCRCHGGLTGIPHGTPLSSIALVVSWATYKSNFKVLGKATALLETLMVLQLSSRFPGAFKVVFETAEELTVSPGCLTVYSGSGVNFSAMLKNRFFRRQGNGWPQRDHSRYSLALQPCCLASDWNLAMISCCYKQSVPVHESIGFTVGICGLHCASPLFSSCFPVVL